MVWLRHMVSEESETERRNWRLKAEAEGVEYDIYLVWISRAVKC